MVAAFIAWTQAHAALLAAIALVAGTFSQVEKAVVGALEVKEHVEHVVEPEPRNVGE